MADESTLMIEEPLVEEPLVEEPLVEEKAVAPSILDLNVTVRFKKNEHVDIEIDQDRVGWKDLKILNRLQSETDEDKAEEIMFDLLTKVTGQDMRTAPARVINAVLAELSKISQGLNNPNA